MTTLVAFLTIVCPEDFSVLANSSCNFKLKIQQIDSGQFD